MKPVIVAMEDLADGLRLAGIAVFSVASPKELPEIVERIRTMPGIGLVLVDERFMESFEKALAGTELPMIASFPAEEIAREEAYIDELTRRFLGQKIYVEGD